MDDNCKIVCKNCGKLKYDTAFPIKNFELSKICYVCENKGPCDYCIDLVESKDIYCKHCGRKLII